MQPLSPAAHAAQDPTERAAPLHALTPVARSRDTQVTAPHAADVSPDRTAEQAAVTAAVVVGADARSLEVRYALDAVANVWVAHVTDRRTGETLRTVPAMRVLHQLADLRHGRIDARA